MLETANTKPTGGYELSVSGRVLKVRAFGTWDEEIAQRFAVEFRKLASPLSNKPWAHLVLLDEWVLGTPAIEPIIAELTDWCGARELKRVAHVYCENMLKEYQLDKMVKERVSGFERCHFGSLADAVEWLEQEGFAVPTPLLVC